MQVKQFCITSKGSIEPHLVLELRCDVTSSCSDLNTTMSEGAGVDKSLLAFFNGLSKRLYFSEQDITDEFLRCEVLGGISDEGEL